MPLTPAVLYPLTLPGLLDYILTTPSASASTILIVCSSRDAFLEDLLHALQRDRGTNGENSLQNLIAPTLHNLSTARHVQLTFCATVQALLAYLTAYARPGVEHVADSVGKARLVLVNPLAMHAPTTSFSAQGLSRTFATAAEAALRTRVVLNLVECQGQPKDISELGDEDMERTDDHEQARVAVEPDPWDQEVSILNVSARRYASSSGERAWAGRTVKARSIAARWARFHQLDGQHTGQDAG